MVFKLNIYKKGMSGAGRRGEDLPRVRRGIPLSIPEDSEMTNSMSRCKEVRCEDKNVCGDAVLAKFNFFGGEESED